MNGIGIIQSFVNIGRKAWQNPHGTSPFVSNVLLTLVTNVLLAGLGFVTGVFAARLLGPQGRGELAAIQMWPSFIGTIAMLGLPEALVYFSARNPERAGRYMGSAMSLALLSSFPFMVTGYLMMPLLLSAQSGEVVSAARWYLWLVPLYALVGLPYNPLRGRQDFFRWNVIRLLPNLGWLVVLCSAFMLRHAEPQFLAGAYLVMLALLFFPVIAVVLKCIPGPYSPQRKQWGPLVKFGIPSVGSTLPQMLNYRLDQMVMVAFLPSHSLGLYVVGVAWGNMVSPLLSAIGAVMFPKVAGEPNVSRQAQVFGQAARLAVFFSLLLGGLIFILTPWGLPWIFGEKFHEAVPVALVLVAAGAVSGLNLVLEDGLRGLGRPTTLLWAEGVGVFVTVLSLWLLLPLFRMMGAAIASLLGYSAVNIFLTIWATRLTKASISAMLWPAWSEVRSVWNNLVTFTGILAK
jgi:O-antigen/teichoic acid export membrane protein